jgi:hypothetical protein
MRKLRFLFLCLTFFLSLHSVFGQRRLNTDFALENYQILSLNNRNELTKLLFTDTYPANVDRLNLSQDVIFVNCPAGQKRCSENKQTIDIWTEASAAFTDLFTYNYVISGGKIVGKGAKVVWDLSNAKPGEYLITAGVDDGCGVCGKTQTRKVYVVECPNASDENFPSENISGFQLSRTEVFISCPFKKLTRKRMVCLPENNLIKVRAALPSSVETRAIYRYEITGGQIISNGSEFEWDLSKAEAGTYTITVSADTGRGFCGNQISQTIRAVKCPSCK